ncbi:hypothetical protein KDN24_00490 [Bacillus sp. Bva_UNVM-123]|uniref:hypothetical protein n=1 Tax=Bacillus sp. Bva_UNVM-123 TaxID=2829798 RepID=UPI00391FBA98
MFEQLKELYYFIPISTNAGILVGCMEGGEITNTSAKGRIIIAGDNVFSELRLALEQIKEVDERQDLILLVDDMENSVGTPTFNEKYKCFMSNAANHYTLLSPLLTKLIEFLM